METPNTNTHQSVDVQATTCEAQKKNISNLYTTDDDFEEQIKEDIKATLHLADIDAEMENFN